MVGAGCSIGGGNGLGSLGFDVAVKLGVLKCKFWSMRYHTSSFLTFIPAPGVEEKYRARGGR